ncbi:phosphoribosyltransferase-like protein [Desulfolutivibrio sp.]|uniref:phosphoribosyltransferase-like protein n=1 Tax=Desulfolutivibrio sp. TaxID=2773296 RepID=UPI002F9699EE
MHLTAVVLFFIHAAALKGLVISTISMLFFFMANLSKTDLGRNWLNSFTDFEERKVAAALIDAILLVSRDELVRSIRDQIETILNDRSDTARPIALFAEREVQKISGVPQPFFPGTESGRATGVGVAAIGARPSDKEVGSEGIIANIITEFARMQKKNVLSHPGPEEMRSRRISSIVIVADFIGSGKRMFEMLESFRRVRTLRSWKSYKIIDFKVVSYSASKIGLNTVCSSKLKPDVYNIVGCPTIYNTFFGKKLEEIKKICRKYSKKYTNPFGFLNVGALIAFAHGIPNNAPQILHSTRSGWTPLFRGRGTAMIEFSFPSEAIETVAERASRLLPMFNANCFLVNHVGSQWIKTMVVLAAIEGGARSASDISACTGLHLSCVDEILNNTQIAHWTDDRNVLTTLGKQELASLRRRRRRAPILPKLESKNYYPTQLRAR